MLMGHMIEVALREILYEGTLSSSSSKSVKINKPLFYLNAADWHSWIMFCIIKR